MERPRACAGFGLLHLDWRLPPKRFLGIGNHYQAHFGSPNTCSAAAVIRPTRTALFDSFGGNLPNA